MKLARISLVLALWECVSLVDDGGSSISDNLLDLIVTLNFYKVIDFLLKSCLLDLLFGQIRLLELSILYPFHALVTRLRRLVEIKSVLVLVEKHSSDISLIVCV